MQQINLLNPQLLTPRVSFSSRTMVWMLLAVLALGLAAYFWGLAATRDIQSRVAQAQAERDELQSRIDALSQPSEDGLTAEDKRAQALVAARQRLAHLQKLRAALGGVYAEAGFSPRLRALSSEGLPGVWLTGIEFGEAGMRLEGRALQASNIPDFLAILARQPALDNLALSGFSILPPEATTDGQAAPPGVAFAVNPLLGGQP
jgi:Tfp pilus assembly protein PilN